jgi:hypothetical protein
MLCKKKGGLWFTLIFAIMVATGVFNQRHGAEKNHLHSATMPVSVSNKGAAHEHDE